jgi:hypothetical protein
MFEAPVSDPVLTVLSRVANESRKNLDFRCKSCVLTQERLMPRDFKVIVDGLQSDGALRDFRIRATNRLDWHAVLRQSRINREANRFTVDSEPRGLPQTFEVIEHLRQQASLCWNVLVAGADVNCHFFCEKQIEFDFRPEDYGTPERWSELCAFFQEIIDVVGKSGVVTHEHAEDDVIDRFEPRTKDEKSLEKSPCLDK